MGPLTQTANKAEATRVVHMERMLGMGREDKLGEVAFEMGDREEDTISIASGFGESEKREFVYYSNKE